MNTHHHSPAFRTPAAVGGGSPRRRLFVAALAMGVAVLSLSAAAPLLGAARAPAPGGAAQRGVVAPDGAPPAVAVPLSDWPDGVAAPAQGVYDVAIRDNYYEPQVITVPEGSWVRWTNRGTNIHTTTSDVGLWNRTLTPGGQYSVLFLQANTHPYHCLYHPDMTGTVVVTSTQGTATPTATTEPVPTQGPFPADEIAYDAQPSGQRRELFAIRPDGTGKVRLTNTANLHEAQPDWSPDHQSLAYVASEADPPYAAQGIQILDIETRQVRTVTSGPAHYEPTWRPDGSMLAFTEFTWLGTAIAQSAISTVLPDGTGYRQLVVQTGGTYGIINPDWSPDGSRIAFAATSDATGGELYVMNADGTNPMPLAARPGFDDIHPAWSPDGRLVAFVSGAHVAGQTTLHDLWLLDPSTGLAGTIARAQGWDLSRPAWSPDGSEIVFHARVGSSPYGLYVVSAQGGLVRGPLDEGTQPDWGSQPLVTVVARPPTLSAPATALPMPTFPPSGPPPTPGIPPTFPPLPTEPPVPTATDTPTATATVAASASPTGTASATRGPTASRTPFVESRYVYLPYAADGHDLTSGGPIEHATPTPTSQSCLRHEAEPNNTTSQADANPPVCADVTVAGSLPAGDDEDIFRIEVTSNATIASDLLLTSLPDGSDYDLQLFRAGGLSPIASSSSSGRTTEHLAVAATAGTYYLRVVPATGSVRGLEEYRLLWYYW